MSVNVQYPILDGIAPSWGDLSCKMLVSGAALLEMIDVKSINTGTSLEIGEQRGASGGRVVMRTTGQDKNEASMTLYASGHQKLIRTLASVAPVRGNQRILSLVHFGIQYLFTPPNTDEIYEIRIKGVRYIGRAANASEGTDANTVDVSLSVAQIVDMIDGKECVLL